MHTETQVDQPWTNDDIHLLKSKYVTHGTKALTRMLKRSREDVAAKAKELGLTVGDIRGWVPIKAVAEAANRSYHVVRIKALKSGFARRLPTEVLIVPEIWADAYIKSIQRGEAADELVKHYYDVRKTARIFGVKPITIYHWLYGHSQTGAKIMDRIGIVVTSDLHGRQYLFEPYSVEKEAKVYRAATNRR